MSTTRGIGALPRAPLRVGLMPPNDWHSVPAVERRVWLRSAADAGIDHIGVGDHVSFRSVFGMDGIVNATAVVAMEPRLTAMLAIYLVLLRHPVTVARSLSTLSELGPGRVVFGVGIGGEDPRELANCGVLMEERGRRMEESLMLLRALLCGRPVTHSGEFFSVEDAVIPPPPDPPIPIVIGGRSAAVLKRAGRLTEGWLAIWVSARRFGEALEEVSAEAARVGRSGVRWQHGLNVWTGFGKDSGSAEAVLAADMEDGYGIAFERFRRWCPCGPPHAVAEFLSPYVEAGCSSVNIIARSATPEAIVDDVAAVREALLKEHPRAG